MQYVSGPTYVKTSLLVEKMAEHIGAVCSGAFDGVFPYRGTIQSALATMLTPDEPLRKAWCGVRVVQRTPAQLPNGRPGLSSAGTPLVTGVQVEVAIVVPTGGQGDYADDVARLSDLTDAVVYEVFDPRAATQYDTELYSAFQKISYVGDEDVDAAGGVICSLVTFTMLPQRE